VLTDFGKCTIPVSARISIDSNGRMTAEFEYGVIDAKELADFLLTGFGVDADQIDTEIQ